MYISKQKKNTIIKIPCQSRSQSLRSPWPAVGKLKLWEQPFQACAIDADCAVKLDGQNSVISFVISNWLLRELPFSDHRSRVTKTLGTRLMQTNRVPRTKQFPRDRQVNNCVTVDKGQKYVRYLFIYVYYLIWAVIRWKDEKTIRFFQWPTVEVVVAKKSTFIFPYTWKKKKAEKGRKERVEKQNEKTTKEKQQERYSQVLEDFF